MLWRLILLLLMAGHSALAADIRSAPPARYQPTKAEKAVQLLLPPTTQAHVITLASPSAEEQAQFTRVTKAALDPARGNKARPLPIGYARAPNASDQDLALRSLSWQTVEGGQAAKVALTSPTAAAVRLGLRWKTAPAAPHTIHLRFTGSAAQRVFGPVSGDQLATATLHWSPVLEGETGIMEIYVPKGASLNGAVLSLPQISHLEVSGADLRFYRRKRVQEIGASDFCEVDVACVSNPSQALRDAATSAAHMVFTDAGSTFLCSGNLLNSADASFIPYLHTANHCISTQAAAGTLNTYWFFAADVCNNLSEPPNYVITGGGATLLHNDPANDASFLRLNAQPPAGVLFGAWNANPISAGLIGIVLHYPQGDLEKFSQGTIQGFGPFGGQGSFITMRYSTGSTEVGSSGAGLLTFNSGGGFYELRGGLYGGDASCTNTNGTDSFSRLDVVYPSIAAYLAPTSGPQTGWWWNPNESGRGFFIEQRGSTIVMSGYIYDISGNPIWFLSSGPVSNNVFSAAMQTYRGGQSLTGPYVAPILGPSLGNITVQFTSPTQATISWPGGTLQIVRFTFASGGVGLPENGWWWNSQESGRGYSLEVQGNVLFIAGYMYDLAGNPIWYISSGTMNSPTSYSGTWQQYANGQAIGGPYRTPILVNANVGGLILNFTDARNGILTLPDGRQIAITRFVF